MNSRILLIEDEPGLVLTLTDLLGANRLESKKEKYLKTHVLFNRQADLPGGSALPLPSKPGHRNGTKEQCEPQHNGYR
jgi:hypothetical protein